ncbi:MAG: hypothetical protein RL701_2756 [Pseudomonadota bacterium]
MTTLTIGRHSVGTGQPVFIVAELSANHGQRLDIALATVRAAAQAGADAIKLQTYTPETMTLRSREPAFMVNAGLPGGGRPLFELYAEAQTPWEWHPPIKAEAEACGLEFFSTPFDASAVHFLVELGVCALKIASFELVDLPLIRAAAATGKPLIMSTGMASLAEIDDAVQAARSHGARDIVLLRCTSAYPAPADSMRLRHIPLFRELFGVATGLSDHTCGVAAAAAATALGACVIEKHFIVSRDIGGPDAAFSLTPDEFKGMVTVVRDVEAASRGDAAQLHAIDEPAAKYRRSLWVVRDIARGEAFTAQNVRSLRPALGLAPKHWDEVMAQRAADAIAAGTPLAWSHLAGPDRR